MSDYLKINYFWIILISDLYWKKLKISEISSNLYDLIWQLKQDHFDFCNDCNWDCQSSLTAWYVLLSQSDVYEWADSNHQLSASRKLDSLDWNYNTEQWHWHSKCRHYHLLTRCLLAIESCSTEQTCQSSERENLLSASTEFWITECHSVQQIW